MNTTRGVDALLRRHAASSLAVAAFTTWAVYRWRGSLPAPANDLVLVLPATMTLLWSDVIDLVATAQWSSSRNRPLERRGIAATLGVAVAASATALALVVFAEAAPRQWALRLAAVTALAVVSAISVRRVRAHEPVDTE